jgi:hypothetical protein
VQPSRSVIQQQGSICESSRAGWRDDGRHGDGRRRRRSVH